MAATIPASRFSRAADRDRMSGTLIECSGILIGYFREQEGTWVTLQPGHMGDRYPAHMGDTFVALLILPSPST